MRSQAVLLQLAKRSARISAFNGGGHILGMNSDDTERKQLKHSIFSDTVGGRIRGGGGGEFWPYLNQTYTIFLHYFSDMASKNRTCLSWS